MGEKKTMEVLGCSDFRFLRQSYITKRLLEFSPLRCRLGEKEIAAAAEAVNHVIENASAFGFPKIEALARKIKSAIKSGDLDEAESYISQMYVYLEKIAEELS